MDNLIIGIVVGLALGAAAGALILSGALGFGGKTSLFAPKFKRLIFLERLPLDGSRKLVLIRRDDKEHLLMIGGPIDVVVETGIKAPEAFSSISTMSGPQDGSSSSNAVLETEPLREEPRLASLSSLSARKEAPDKDEAALTLTTARETKALRSS